MDSNTAPGCEKATDPDMALSSSPGPPDTMTSSDSAGHQSQHGSSGSMALGYQHGQQVVAYTWASV